jgi:hypothetical protein
VFDGVRLLAFSSLRSQPTSAVPPTTKAAAANRVITFFIPVLLLHYRRVNH